MGKGGRLDFLSQGKISDVLIRCARNRGFCMSAHVLLNLLNELGERDGEERAGCFA